MTNVTQPEWLNVGLPVMRDPVTGTVYLVVNDWVFAAGNARSGEIFLFRQVDKSNVEKHRGVRCPVGWTMALDPEQSEDDRARAVAVWFLLLNMGVKRNPLPDEAAHVGNLLAAVSDTHLPAMVEAGATMLSELLVASQILVNAKQGQASMEEVTLETEKLVTLVSVLPQEELTRPLRLTDAPTITTGHAS